MYVRVSCCIVLCYVVGVRICIHVEAKREHQCLPPSPSSWYFQKGSSSGAGLSDSSETIETSQQALRIIRPLTCQDCTIPWQPLFMWCWVGPRFMLYAYTTCTWFVELSPLSSCEISLLNSSKKLFYTFILIVSLLILKSM